MRWSIVVVAKGLWPVTVQCLQSMYDTLPEGREYEVVYVDNGSPQGESGAEAFTDWIAAHPRMSGILLVVPPVKRSFYRGPDFDYGVGLSTAWNMAIRASSGERILIVNNDLSFAGSDWLEAFENKTRDGTCGLVGVTNMSWHNVAFNQGSLLAMRRDLFDRIGPFDERMEFSCEEVDYHYRASTAGFHNETCDWLVTKVRHVDGVTRRHYRDSEWYMLFLSHQARLLFCYKWPEIPGGISIND